MILSDLIQLPATEGGVRVGYVVDARFEHDPETEDGIGEARLVGLIVSPGKGASFLGYERNAVASPWLLARYLAWRHRESFLVGWKDIEVVSREAVVLREGFERRSPSLDQD